MEAHFIIQTPVGKCGTIMTLYIYMCILFAFIYKSNETHLYFREVIKKKTGKKRSYLGLFCHFIKDKMGQNFHKIEAVRLEGG